MSGAAAITFDLDKPHVVRRLFLAGPTSGSVTVDFALRPEMCSVFDQGVWCATLPLCLAVFQLLCLAICLSLSLSVLPSLTFSVSMCVLYSACLCVCHTVSCHLLIVMHCTGTSLTDLLLTRCAHISIECRNEHHRLVQFPDLHSVSTT